LDDCAVIMCVCDVYCTVYVYGTFIWFMYIPYLHTVEYQSYKLVEYEECWMGVIVEAQHYLILYGPDMPSYC